ncbi:MAG: GNAT family N-acetyltransferase [Streptosporangiaceae bacterium]|nr:GNAT family N-acetyltransferase [Streptosporangiaceae bacterium]
MVEVTACAGGLDEQVSLDIYNAVWPHDAITMDEVRSFKASVRDHVDYLARIEGAAVGSAVGVIFPQRADRVFTILTVLAGQRRCGAGSALYQAICRWTAARGRRELEVAVLDNDAGSLAFAQRRGFTEERREVGLVLDLAGTAPYQGGPPAGVEIVTWAERPELARGMYEVALEALPDIPGSEADSVEPFGDWLAHDMHGSGDRPEATFVALAGPEVVGYAKFSLTAAQPTIARHDLTAVKRAWRGRGVARALKAAQINWALAHGYTELRTRNEQRNEPIRRLNAHFGYRPGTGRIYLVGPPAAAGATRRRSS